MKIIRAMKIFLPVLLVAFVFTNCDMKDSSVGTFDDVADKLPNFTVMEGAENVTVRVQRNNDRAYFNVNLTNLGREAAILDGDYLGWCAHWSAPIDTRGQAYDDITLYSTRYDKNWNKLNYLLNNRARFYNEIDGAGYKEIQAVIWTLIEFKEFDIDKNQIFDDLNRAAFDAILDDVREHGDSFEHTPLTRHAIFADMSEHVAQGSEPTQTVIVEGTAWSWAAPHTLNANSFRIHDIGRRWGWVTYYWFYEVGEDDEGNPVIGSVFTGIDNSLEAGLYADCGFGNVTNPEPADFEDCPLVADVRIWHDDSNMLHIHIESIDNEFDYPALNFSVYADTLLPDQLDIGNFPYKKDNFFDQDDPFNFKVEFKIDLDEDFGSNGTFVFDKPTVDDFPSPDSGELPVPPLYILIHGDTEEITDEL